MSVRKFKQKQLWITSGPDQGKTLFALHLSKMLKVYWVPIDDAWDDLYTDDYDLVVFDEYVSQRRVTWLNSFVQGGVFPVKRRCQAPYVKQKNIPVIVLSNYTIEKAYWKAGQVAWDTLNARFKSVNLTQSLFSLFQKYITKEKCPATGYERSEYGRKGVSRILGFREERRRRAPPERSGGGHLGNKEKITSQCNVLVHYH